LREVQEQRSNDLATLDQLRADARLKEEELRQANEQIGRLRRQRDAAIQSYFDAFKVAEESSLGLKTAKEDFVRLKDAVESKSFFRL
jgi:succinate dehydrogenase/fumarate reductase flavoprotein subunit